MGNGIAEILQNPTSDHTQATKARRLPLGDLGASTGHYFSVVDLIKRWPEVPARRKVLMLSDGIDRFRVADPRTLMWTPPLKKRRARGSPFTRATAGP
jgi:hypothetical protein